MKLNQAISRIADLPNILEQYGISSENVISVQYSDSAMKNADILVHLHRKETIKKLGNCDVETFIGYDDASWTQYRFDKDGISFVCCEREAIA